MVDFLTSLQRREKLESFLANCFVPVTLSISFITAVSSERLICPDDTSRSVSQSPGAGLRRNATARMCLFHHKSLLGKKARLKIEMRVCPKRKRTFQVHLQCSNLLHVLHLLFPPSMLITYAIFHYVKSQWNWASTSNP